MAFVFHDEHEFEWPVTVRVPQGGSFVDQSFTALFLMLPDQEFLKTPGDATPAALLEAELERLRRVWTGWEGIETADGAPLPYSDAQRDKMLAMRPVREGLARAYTDAVFRGGLREKN